MPCIGQWSLCSTHPALVQVQDYVSDTDADDDDDGDDDCDEPTKPGKSKMASGSKSPTKPGKSKMASSSKSPTKPGKSNLSSSSKSIAKNKARTPQEYLVGFTMVPPNVMGEGIQNFGPARSFDMCGKRKRASGVCYIVERAELLIR